MNDQFGKSRLKSCQRSVFDNDMRFFFPWHFSCKVITASLTLTPAKRRNPLVNPINSGSPLPNFVLLLGNYTDLFDAIGGNHLVDKSVCECPKKKGIALALFASNSNDIFNHISHSKEVVDHGLDRKQHGSEADLGVVLLNGPWKEETKPNVVSFGVAENLSQKFTRPKQILLVICASVDKQRECADCSYTHQVHLFQVRLSQRLHFRSPSEIKSTMCLKAASTVRTASLCHENRLQRDCARAS